MQRRVILIALCASHLAGCEFRMQVESTPKKDVFCKDCRWFDSQSNEYMQWKYCQHPKTERSPVTGAPNFAAVRRQFEISCGPKGRDFAPVEGKLL